MSHHNDDHEQAPNAPEEPNNEAARFASPRYLEMDKKALELLAEELVNGLERIVDHEPYAQLGSTASERIALVKLEWAYKLGLSASERLRAGIDDVSSAASAPASSTKKASR